MDRKIVELLVAKRSHREICEQLRIGTGRLAKVKALAEAYGYFDFKDPKQLPTYPEMIFPDRPDRRQDRGSEADEALQAKKDWIIERLDAGWRPITVFEELGSPIARSSFYRFLNRSPRREGRFGHLSGPWASLAI